MQVNQQAPAARRLVGSALRRYRESLGYGLADAARILDCSPSKVSRFETGQRGITRRELRLILTEYGVDEPAQELLSVIAKQGTSRGWWQKYTDVIPGARCEYLALEAIASEIMIYEAHRIPEMLQTEPYARMLTAASAPGSDVAARSDEAVLARQQILRQEPVAAARVVIGEAALRSPASHPDVMKEQLSVLARAGWDACRRLTIQILPSGAEVAAGGAGSMAMLRFAPAQAAGVVHLDDPAGGTCREDPDALATYSRVFEQLSAVALSPAQSRDMLSELTAA